MMKTLRLSNCLIGGINEQEINIYAPKASACIILPYAYVQRFLDLDLKQKCLPQDTVLEATTNISGNRIKALDLLDNLIEYGVLIQQEATPSWKKIPQPTDKKPVDIMIVVVNYPYAGDVNTPVPFGGMTIASSLREKGFKVAIVDMALERLEPWKIVPYLRRYTPQIVGLSAITAAGQEAEKVSRWIKRWARAENSNFKGVILGGHHATDFTKSALFSGCFEIVLAGKLGFLSAPSAFEALLNGKVQEIPGVHWHIDDKTVRGIPLSWQPTAQIPTPSWDLVEKEKYSAPGVSFWGMGCPFGCVYCTLGSVPKIYRPLKEIEGELQDSMQKGCHKLALMDDEIFHNQQRTEEIVGMLERNPDFRKADLYLQSRIDSTISRHKDGLLKRLNKAVKSLYVEMGADGLTQKDLDMVRKGRKITIESPFKVIDIAQQAGCRIGFGSIFGFPWNTKDDLQEQSNYIQSLLNYAKRQVVDLTIMSGVFTPFPGSVLGEKIMKGELPGVKIVNHSPECFDFHNPNIDTPFWNHQYLEQFMVAHFQRVM